MTDLERAQWAIRGEPETWIPMIVMHFAEVRREGAEQASGEIHALRKALHEETMRRLASAEEATLRAEIAALRDTVERQKLVLSKGHAEVRDEALEDAAHECDEEAKASSEGFRNG